MAEKPKHIKAPRCPVCGKDFIMPFYFDPLPRIQVPSCNHFKPLSHNGWELKDESQSND